MTLILKNGKICDRFSVYRFLRVDFRPLSILTKKAVPTVSKRLFLSKILRGSILSKIQNLNNLQTIAN